jgi:uncharacterized protein (DUF924 family)
VLEVEAPTRIELAYTGGEYLGRTAWELAELPNSTLVAYVYRGVKANSSKAADHFARWGTRLHGVAMREDALAGLARIFGGCGADLEDEAWRQDVRRRVAAGIRALEEMRSDPESILEFWFGRAAGDPAEASARETSWFGASGEADSLIRERFASAIEAAARGELDSWVQVPRSALALALLLDQFPRNIWRGTAKAFTHDARALRVAKEAVARGHLHELAPVEQAFLVLPLQHSESVEDQRESVRLSSEIAQAAPKAWRPLLERYLQFARQHLALVERFGRFPHRNHVLGRRPTPEEEAYLREGGDSFGQGTRDGTRRPTSR